MKTLLLSGLASLVLLHTLPSTARADGERGSRAEQERYARREASTPSLETFKGGGCWNPGPEIILLIPLAIAFAPFYLLYKGGEAVVRFFTPRNPKPARKTEAPQPPPPPPKGLSRLAVPEAACA